MEVSRDCYKDGIGYLIGGCMMDINEILKLASLAGQIILENGGETYRTEDTIVRMLENKVDKVETFVTPTGIFVSVEQDGKIYTKIIRILKRSTDLNKVALVNAFSRRFSQEELAELDIKQYTDELLAIKEMDGYKRYITIFGAGIAAAGSVMLFGGSPGDFISTFIIAMAIQVCIGFFQKLELPNFIVNCFGGALATIFSILFSQTGLGSLDMLIVGSVMILVPGVPITNSIRDVISGDLVSGTSRGVDALISAAGIALGVGVFLNIWYIAGGLG